MTRKPPNRGKIAITFRLEPEISAALDLASKATGLKKVTIVEQALREWLVSRHHMRPRHADSQPEQSQQGGHADV